MMYRGAHPTLPTTFREALEHLQVLGACEKGLAAALEAAGYPSLSGVLSTSIPVPEEFRPWLEENWPELLAYLEG